MALASEIADAVVAELNATPLNLPLTAGRVFVPAFALQNMQNLRVSVVPRTVEVTAGTRHRNIYDVEVDVAVQKKFASGSAAEIDPLLTLVDEIADFFRLRSLTEYPSAHWIRTEYRSLCAQEHWDELRQFTSVLTLTFRVVR